jgi:hypothetical protein
MMICMYIQLYVYMHKYGYFYIHIYIYISIYNCEGDKIREYGGVQPVFKKGRGLGAEILAFVQALMISPGLHKEGDLVSVKLGFNPTTAQVLFFSRFCSVFLSSIWICFFIIIDIFL